MPFGDVPTQPDGASYVWVVTSFAQLPFRGGVFCGGAGLQIGRLMPFLGRLNSAWNSGLWEALMDRDAIATAP